MPATNREEELKKIRDRLDRAKQLKAEAQGSRQELLRQLKEEFDLSDPIEAKKALVKMEKEVDELDSEIDRELREVLRILDQTDQEEASHDEE